MRVALAGYNVDSGILEKAAKAGIPGISKDTLTPEVISAAYARISRDPRPVKELRQKALDEVEQARKSNKNIIFKMGHHSVAEHAVFNFDITGISRLAIEALESFRLCSFTEKSQRYITLDHDFVIPLEIADTEHESSLVDLVSSQAECYKTLHTALKEHFAREYPELSQNKKGKRLIDGMAKEDARYATILATTGQLGLTANARNLEHMIRRFSAEHLKELASLGKKLHETASQIAPSVLLFTEAGSFYKHSGSLLAGKAPEEDLSKINASVPFSTVKLVSHTEDPDRKLGAALLFRYCRASYETCTSLVRNMDKDALVNIFHTALKDMEFYDSPLREFEHVSMTLELTISSSCYAQLKRHRMSTQSVQDYDTRLGITIPESVKKAKMEDILIGHVLRSEKLYFDLLTKYPRAAQYALTNAHRRRVLITMNLRELYHFMRLRDDIHSQWDIRYLAGEIKKIAKDVMPLGTLLLSGKDKFLNCYKDVFGYQDRVDPASL